MKKIVTLLGLPRSGTTLVTSIFAVHPDIAAWFEPWNSSPNHSLEPIKNLDDYIKKFYNKHKVNITNKKVFLMKETTVNKQSVEWIFNTLKNLSEENFVDIKIIWLIRDINHSFLSKIQASKEWWGYENIEIDANQFKKYIDFAYNSFKNIEKICDLYDSCLLSYEKFIYNKKEILNKAMNFIGLSLHNNQLEYHLYIKKNNKICGDRNLRTNPKPVTEDTILKREKEWNIYRDSLLSSLNEIQMEKYSYMMNIVNEIKEKGIKVYKKN